jgi:O-acetyl-ADP-ribose deacetylase (regulator of RNase III)
MKSEFMINNTKLSLMQGDIADLAVDVIVNAANAQLILGSGVAGSIKEKGGPTIQEECNRIGGTYVGGAVLTSGGDLKAKNVIHAVGPKMGEGEEEIKLRNATMNSLLLAEEHDLYSIAFPAISTGIYGYSVDKCAKIMLTVTTEFIRRPGKLKEVIFCLWTKENYHIFKKTLEDLLKVKA